MRPVIPVACGALVDAEGAVLIARRPSGKIAAGKWEFPGGKIEAGESAGAALARELHEELGITVQRARPLIRITHDYSDRTVVLDTWRVEQWSGELHCREGQQVAWVRPEQLHQHDLLAADGPIVRALQLPSIYVFTPPQANAGQVLAGVDRLPRGALLRLRLPQLADDAYETLAQRVIERGRGLRVMLDRSVELVQRVGAAGLHLSAARVAAQESRRLPEPFLLGGSAHNAGECTALRRAGADFAVLGPVLPTATHPQSATLGWSDFGLLATKANLAVYAIGGVGPDDLAQAHACYAQGVAGISAYWS
ncbi:MAG TPA: Nudix family hydrolase [Nevskiaceae bacterium]|nr:Nudix family hydrolase [Nevskiaceae bacterium]